MAPDLQQRQGSDVGKGAPERRLGGWFLNKIKRKVLLGVALLELFLLPAVFLFLEIGNL